jgi:hypothetical protein
VDHLHCGAVEALFLFVAGVDRMTEAVGLFSEEAGHCS